MTTYASPKAARKLPQWRYPKDPAKTVKSLQARLARLEQKQHPRGVNLNR